MSQHASTRQPVRETRQPARVYQEINLPLLGGTHPLANVIRSMRPITFRRFQTSSHNPPPDPFIKTHPIFAHLPAERV